MTLLEINLTDVLLETDPDDKVIVWAPVMREGPAGQLVGTRRKEIPLTDGVGSDEVVPGPLMVQVQCKAMRDTRPREVVVPEDGPVTLTALMDGAGAFTYSPAVVGKVAQYRDDAVQAVVDAEAARDVAVQAAGTVAGAEVTITEARDQAVQSVTTTRDQAVTAVEDTRDSVVADVNLAGSTAATAIAGQVTAAEGHATTAGGHATQTADDRRQTGEDRTQTGLDRQAAAQSATDAATSATTAEGHKTTVQTALAGAQLYSGTGFPTGVVTAPVGSIYTDTAATNGAIRWIKTSGTGNTGWTVEYGYTGRRSVTSGFYKDTEGMILDQGTVDVSRTNDLVSFALRNLKVSEPGSRSLEAQLPPGFAPSATLNFSGLIAGNPGARISVTTGGIVRLYTLSPNNWLDHFFSLVWHTSSSWPATLPGTPV